MKILLCVVVFCMVYTVYSDCDLPPSLWCSSGEIAKKCGESKGIEEWKFECQHGKEECVGNLIETCAISILAKKSVYVPFIYCMEKAFTMPEQSAKECATQLGIDLDPIMKCSTSSMGNELEHQMALLTDALNPPHKYVPWIVINGIHTEPLQNKAQSHLLKVICEMYKGDTPQACKQFLKSSGRCYRD